MTVPLQRQALHAWVYTYAFLGITTFACATSIGTKLYFELTRPSSCAQTHDTMHGTSHTALYLMVRYMLYRRGLLAIRGCFGFGAIGCYFFAVTLLPLNDAMVITFLAPLVVALASPVVIKESPPT